MKKMIRAVCCLLPVALMLLLIGCGKKTPAEHVYFDAKTDDYESLEEVENVADVIIRVKKTDKEEPVLKYHDGAVYSCYTFSTVNVEEIYNDKTGVLKEGESIRVLENEAYDPQNNKVYHIADYYMMKKDAEYILLLKKAVNETGEYYVSIAVNFGTVSVADDGREDAFKKVNPDYYEHYLKIWSAARAKYL